MTDTTTPNSEPPTDNPPVTYIRQTLTSAELSMVAGFEKAHGRRMTDDGSGDL